MQKREGHLEEFILSAQFFFQRLCHETVVLLSATKSEDVAMALNVTHQVKQHLTTMQSSEDRKGADKGGLFLGQ